jgi:hypothetical protein
MKILNRLLISLPLQGFLWILFLFVFSFFCVHLVKLALLGAESLRKTPPEPLKPPEKTEEKKAPAPQAQEPVYYIVEKKTRRPKSSYSEPKQIKFK